MKNYQFYLMTRIILFTIILFSFNSCFAQESSKKNKANVRLVKWSAIDCDNTYDPYRLKNRITNIQTIDGITFITVNFSDNCCAKFKPIINFIDNKLILLPYKEYFGENCSCNCCFSINFVIEGIGNSNYEVHFKGEKIEHSENHYKTVEPSFDSYNGFQINKINKYGFKEGVWIQFYKNGKEKSVVKYPNNSNYYEPRPEWSKQFSESGKLLYFSRKDTSESWFEDGELKSQTIKYTSKDTIFEKSLKRYENRIIQEKYLERRYPLIFRSEFDSTYKRTGTRWDYIYKEEYYSNGQLKFKQGTDTIYSWFENGTIKSKSYNAGKLEYDEKGQLVVRSFHWVEPGIKGLGDLNFDMNFEYLENGDIQSIQFVRDEPSKNGKSITLNVHYNWRWNKEFNLIESPKKWNENYPWEKIKDFK